MKRDDVELIQRILAGDETAFASLIRRYQQQVHAHVLRKVKDFHIAEDITQETFLKVYQKLDTLEDPSQFRKWLHAIVNHLCVAWFRKNRRQTELLEETHISGIETEPYSRYLAAEHAKTTTEAQRELIERLLAKLKESDRQVVTLHYFEEMTYSEISEFLGVSENTIKSRLHRARQRLKKYADMVQEALDTTIEAEHRFYENLNGGSGMKLTFESDDGSCALDLDRDAQQIRILPKPLEPDEAHETLTVESRTGKVRMLLETESEILEFWVDESKSFGSRQSSA